MTRRECERLLALSALSSCALGADVPSLSGEWHLNVEKSRWGKRRKPVSVTVKVEHNEPALKYAGTVTLDTEGGTRHFEFNGAIDGTEYPYADGKILIRRIDDRTTTSVYTSSDGSLVETARTTLSRDGNALTRRIESKGPGGTMSWTEVYERK